MKTAENVIRTEIKEGSRGRELYFIRRCYQCQKEYKARNARRDSCLCDDCKKKKQEIAKERKKEEVKKIEIRALKKYQKSVAQAKNMMCKGFCMMPKAFSDKTALKEACSNCPFLYIEGLNK